jgi:hypothetical protein
MRNNLRAAFETKTWAGKRGGSPRSGPGSSMELTQQLRLAFPRIIEQYGVKTLVDAPCGDWFWMQHVDLAGVSYIGGDISKEITDANSEQFARPGVKFIHLDITSDPIPTADIVLCRDCMMHLKHWLRWEFFKNFVASDSKYLITTVHHVLENKAVTRNGGFKRFNPCIAPFNFSPALELIPETAETLPDDILQNRVADHTQRSIGIWSRQQVVEALKNRAEPTDEELSDL